MATEQDQLARLRKAPSNVRAHYQRMLLEWTVGALARVSSQPAADDSQTTKRRNLNTGAVQELHLVLRPCAKNLITFKALCNLASVAWHLLHTAPSCALTERLFTEQGLQQGGITGTRQTGPV